MFLTLDGGNIQREGCHYCHGAMNNVIHRTLSSAKVLSRLEPSGLHRDGKHPVGITMVPWRNGKLLVWTPPVQIPLLPHMF